MRQLRARVGRPNVPWPGHQKVFVGDGKVVAKLALDAARRHRSLQNARRIRKVLQARAPSDQAVLH